MPLADYAIPAAFNALDDAPFDDGHPVSSWAAREILHNDRILHATLDACLLAKAWDRSHPWQFRGTYWTRLASWSGRITPGRRTATVRLRGTITLDRPVYLAVVTGRRGPVAIQEGAARWTVVNGTGAVANWELTGIEIAGGTMETIEVFAQCGLSGSAAGDVVGALTAIEGRTLRSAAAFGGGMAAGWAIRVEDSATLFPLTAWRTITNFISTSAVTIWPDWGRWEDLPAAQHGSGPTDFRARQPALLELRSLTIDEDALTGELGE